MNTVLATQSRCRCPDRTSACAIECRNFAWYRRKTVTALTLKHVVQLQSIYRIVSESRAARRAVKANWGVPDEQDPRNFELRAELRRAKITKLKTTSAHNMVAAARLVHALLARWALSDSRRAGNLFNLAAHSGMVSFLIFLAAQSFVPWCHALHASNDVTARALTVPFQSISCAIVEMAISTSSGRAFEPVCHTSSGERAQSLAEA